MQHSGELASDEVRCSLEAQKSIGAILVIVAETNVNPSQPEVRRNLDRVHDHVLDPGITNRAA